MVGVAAARFTTASLLAVGTPRLQLSASPQSPSSSVAQRVMDWVVSVISTEPA